MKSLPKSIDNLSPGKKKLFLQNEFGVSSSPKCCAAGYLRLQRLTCSAEYSNLQSLNVPHPVGLPPMAHKEASERTQHTIKQKIKTQAKQRIGEMKAEIENMGASYKEICLEILQHQFDGAFQVKRMSW